MAQKWIVEGKEFDRYVPAHEYAAEISDRELRHVELHTILDNGEPHTDSTGESRGIKIIGGDAMTVVYGPIDVY